ncbi:hypothetical protein M6B38_184910 [Iris pallida]|uniref:Uncharacterized protein n=1 Tax=Iris pallida TaxID=29817 RepID=A0AAX6EKZ6_IRIPA|nr:hypothetical protein M6B38_184910 [Iris pallida]
MMMGSSGESADDGPAQVLIWIDSMGNLLLLFFSHQGVSFRRAGTSFSNVGVLFFVVADLSFSPLFPMAKLNSI